MLVFCFCLNGKFLGLSACSLGLLGRFCLWVGVVSSVGLVSVILGFWILDFLVFCLLVISGYL